MKRLGHVPLWLSTAMLLAFASLARWSPLVRAASPATATAPAAEAQRQIVLAIEGMTCGGCATGVETALKQVHGVRTVSVSYEKGQAVVAVDPTVKHETLVKAVEGAGFRAVGERTTAAEEERPATSASLTILKGSLAPLIDQFNADQDKPRVLALLSPT